MSLTEKEKQMIKDFIMHKSDISPDEWLSYENNDEAIEYGKSLVDEEFLRVISKVYKR